MFSKNKLYFQIDLKLFVLLCEKRWINEHEVFLIETLYGQSIFIYLIETSIFYQ